MIPHGYYGQMCDKPPFVSRTGLIIAAGVIDSDYTGEPVIKSAPTIEMLW
jgi:dUTPase